MMIWMARAMTTTVIIAYILKKEVCGLANFPRTCRDHTGLRFGLPDHQTTTGQASGQANHCVVKQVAKNHIFEWRGWSSKRSSKLNVCKIVCKKLVCKLVVVPKSSQNPIQIHLKITGIIESRLLHDRISQKSIQTRKYEKWRSCTALGFEPARARCAFMRTDH